MKYYLSLQALGDNLISLSLLQQLNFKVNILGTKHTKNIVKLLDLEDQFNVQVVFDDIPAFYDIRKRGFLQAIKHLYTLIRYIQKNQISEIIFEKKDLRSTFILFFTNIKGHFPNNINKKIYKNRKDLIENIYQQPINLNSYILKIENPKKIVINPLTRVELKNINKSHLNFIINELRKYNYEIYLIDIEKRYQEFENKVQYYLTNTTLEDVKQLIKGCDLYVGGDSFLIHLAYYLQRNYFMIFYRDNDDFLPPNITDNFYIKAHGSGNFNDELKLKFKNIGLIK